MFKELLSRITETYIPTFIGIAMAMVMFVLLVLYRFSNSVLHP